MDEFLNRLKAVLNDAAEELTDDDFEDFLCGAADAVEERRDSDGYEEEEDDFDEE